MPPTGLAIASRATGAPATTTVSGADIGPTWPVSSWTRAVNTRRPTGTLETAIRQPPPAATAEPNATPSMYSVTVDPGSAVPSKARARAEVRSSSSRAPVSAAGTRSGAGGASGTLVTNRVTVAVAVLCPSVTV